MNKFGSTAVLQNERRVLNSSDSSLKPFGLPPGRQPSFTSPKIYTYFFLPGPSTALLSKHNLLYITLSRAENFSISSSPFLYQEIPSYGSSWIGTYAFRIARVYSQANILFCTIRPCYTQESCSELSQSFKVVAPSCRRTL